jgi:two-component system sensor histidine kinase KdpD
VIAGYVAALLGVAAMTIAIHYALHYARIANISALYLLVILAVAVGYGSGPAVLASLLAFLAFDWFFVQPTGQWTVHDPAEWVALLTFLAVGLITGHLAGRLRQREAEARRRVEEIEALERLSRTITSRVEAQEALDEVVRRLGEVAPISAAAVLRPTAAGDFEVATGCATRVPLPTFERGSPAAAARLCLEESRAVGWEGDPSLWRKGYAGAEPGEEDERGAFLPLAADGRADGVLYVRPDRVLTAHERRLVETLANHAAVALARERVTREAARVRALEETDRLKDALLSMVSHDFRSPLASIKASLSGLLGGDRGWTPETRREVLVGIDRETDRLTRLVEDLLDMSRLEAGAWRTEREACPVEEWVGVALGTLTPEEDARVSIVLSPDLPAVAVDPPQMERVLVNLLENALKYSSGPVEVAASVEGGRLRLTVADRGPGLAPGEEVQAFEKFYRGAATRPRQVPGRESSIPGSGLGLSVCRAIVEAHGGRLTARNRPGGGAVFTLELPV